MQRSILLFHFSDLLLRPGDFFGIFFHSMVNFLDDLLSEVIPMAFTT